MQVLNNSAYSTVRGFFVTAAPFQLFLETLTAWHIWMWLDLKVIPQIFSGIQVWALRPLKDFHIPVVKPLQR